MIKSTKKTKLSTSNLYYDIKLLIDKSRQNVAATVNVAISILYWNIGVRINREILSNTRAEYGKQTIIALSKQLEGEYGKGWDEKTLRHCIKFAEVFNDEQIVSTPWRQLAWSHIKDIIYIDDPLKENFIFK
jgi:hypothetical protein